MKTLIYSTSKEVKRKRRRIGEFSDEIRRFKNSLTIGQKIALEIKINNL